MNFRTIAIITTIVTLVLGIGYLFAGGIVVGRWQIEPTENVLLLGRRMGALYIGLSVMFFLARSAPSSIARKALSIGTVVVTLLLVMLGIYELAAGHVGSGILISVVIEFLLAIGYIWILFSERNTAVKD